VRHVRILGLCLIAAFGVSAMAATSALAHEPGELTGKWKVFKACPLHNAEMQKAEEEKRANPSAARGAICLVGRTQGGPDGGHFSLGRVVVPLSKKITLQVGAIEHCEEPAGPGEGCSAASNHGTGELELRPVAPENGEKALEAPELPVPGGIKVLSESVQNAAHWPEALKASFKEAVKNKESGLKVEIEVAGGNRLFEEEAGISAECLIGANCTAFELPLKVSLHNPWLSKLGGGPCLIGTDEHPVVQHLTTGTSGGMTGEIGELHLFEDFTLIEIAHNTLVDNTWPVEVPATGCGGSEYESYVDNALSKVLGIPSPAGAGQTILTGTLYDGNAEFAQKNSETGEKFEK